MYGETQESGLTEIIPGCTPQLSGASIPCFRILSSLGAHHRQRLQSNGCWMVGVLCFLRCSFCSSPDNNTCPLVFRGNYIHVKATINYEDAKSVLNLAICSSPPLLLFLPSCSTQVGLLATKLQISKSHLPPSSFGIKMSCSLFYFERIPFKEIILQETEQLK